MPFDEPHWWYGPEQGVLPRLLAPLGDLYGWVAERRVRTHMSYRSKLPVVCIGNLVAGGTGKTPMALHLAEHLRTMGKTPVVLTRGHGGRRRGPHRVVPGTDTANDVGDEALLLARSAPVVVARDRAAGARFIEQSMPSADVILMDDGLQNPALHKTLTFAVIDGTRGIGNGRVIPAGPLRARLAFQIGLIDAAIIMGEANPTEDAAGPSVHAHWRQNFPGPVLAAAVAPAGDKAWLAGTRVIAFAGIGNPARFFTLLDRLGAHLVHRETFADHHRLTDREARDLLALAATEKARLMTTEKDLARLAGCQGACAELRVAARPLPIRLIFSPRDADRLASLMESVFVAGAARA